MVLQCPALSARIKALVTEMKVCDRDVVGFIGVTAFCHLSLDADELL